MELEKEVDLLLEKHGHTIPLEIESIRLSKKKLTYPRLVSCNVLRYVVGAFLIALQTTASLIALTYDPYLRTHYPYHIGFPGIINGVNVILYAMRYQITLALVQFTADSAVAAAKEKQEALPEKIKWDGLPFRKWVQVGMILVSALSIGLAIAFMGVNGFSIALSIRLLKQGTFPVMAELMIFLHVALQICGFISMNTFIEGITTHMQLSRSCCAYCYPLPLYISSKKRGRPLVLL